ncbi:hypothetical protein LIA77_00551 [Sarocladium implicatum]|nr:hypothetical protein LIA77_00551 [Sarocladium implicatum]
MFCQKIFLECLQGLRYPRPLGDENPGFQGKLGKGGKHSVRVHGALTMPYIFRLAIQCA